MNLRGEYRARLGSHKYVPFHLGAPLAAEREKKPLSRAVFVLPWVESTETSEGPRCFSSLLCCKDAVAAHSVSSSGEAAQVVCALDTAQKGVSQRQACSTYLRKCQPFLFLCIRSFSHGGFGSY